MAARLKPLREQVIVVTGATSGIGLATVQMAVAAGARVVLCARDPVALAGVAAELGERAGWAAADVADREAVDRVAATAVERFGGFDTWVNNAGVDIWGKLADTPEADGRRLFDTNFWGTVHGSRAAARHLKHRGGVLVNVGSVLGEVAVPVQGLYSASKHAVHGFTNALRQELLHDRATVRVSLVKPSSMDTPVTRHAGNRLGRPARLPPPVYRPQEAAAAILWAAEHGPRELTVGGGGWLDTLARHLPGLADRLGADVLAPLMAGHGPAPDPAGALFEPGVAGRVRGDHPGLVLPVSLSARAARHPLLAAGLAVAAGAMAAALLARRSDARPL